MYFGMRRSALISFAIHALIILAAIIALPTPPLDNAADSDYSVEFVGPSQPTHSDAKGKTPSPQVAPVLIVVATLQVAQMILQETALSFLGLGLPPPAATWGNILAEGNTRLFIAPWIANFAGLSIIALVWGVNMLGNGLREHYDPKMIGR